MADEDFARLLPGWDRSEPMVEVCGARALEALDGPLARGNRLYRIRKRRRVFLSQPKSSEPTTCTRPTGDAFIYG